MSGMAVSEDELRRALEADPYAAAYLKWQMEWVQTARPSQIPPMSDWNECGYMAGRGFGKGVCINALIPTPYGWVLNGHLRDGDEVFDEQGRVCRVVKAHEPYTPASLYRVHFTDGTHIDADGVHLWTTLTHRARKQMGRHGIKRLPRDWASYRMPLWDSWGNETGDVGAETLETEAMLATLTHSARGDRNHCIPLTFPLALPDADLPIDPWLLGYWLGNGTTNANTLCAGSHKGEFDYPVLRERFGEHRVRAHEAKGHHVVTLPGLLPKLKALGVLGGKFVPAAYMRASEAQRLELLRGLCDSDGYASERGAEFCSTEYGLADAVLELLRSLGERPTLKTDRARLNGKDCGERHRVTWRYRLHNPFSLPRKRDKLSPPDAQGMRSDHRMVEAIEPIPIKTVRCITVDSPSRLYLAGEGMIPTHNTRVGAEWLANEIYCDPSGLPSTLIGPTLGDVRRVMINGQSGLLNVIPKELLVDYNKNDNTITMRNCSGGTSLIQGFSAENPERLRGPEHCRVWADELAAWFDAEETWDMMMMGLRLGDNPKVLWTTTPKPREIVRQLTAKRERRVIVTGSTYDNKANLPDAFFKQLEKYEGTRLGRQELDGELIDPEEQGIIKRSWFRKWPAKRTLPQFEYIIMSLDTAFTEETVDKKSHDPDYTACTVWGTFRIKEELHVMLLDCWQERLGLPDLIKRVRKEMNTAYGDDEDTALIKPLVGGSKPITSGRKPDMLIIEDKGSGISLRQSLVKHNILAYAYNPGKADKLSRLHIVSPVFAHRRVWLPESRKNPGQIITWAEPLVYQLCSFTGSGSIKHDDLVDACAQAMRVMSDKGFITTDKPDRAAPKKEGALPEPLINPYAT